MRILTALDGSHLDSYVAPSWALLCLCALHRFLLLLLRFDGSHFDSYVAPSWALLCLCALHRLSCSHVRLLDSLKLGTFDYADFDTARRSICAATVHSSRWLSDAQASPVCRPVLGSSVSLCSPSLLALAPRWFTSFTLTLDSHVLLVCLWLLVF